MGKTNRCNCANPSGRAAWLFLALLGLAAAGCDDFSRPSGDNLAGVGLRSVNAGELEQVIQSQRGRVVLVDFWATWCGPCRAIFPHNVALERQFGEKGLSVLTVSLDGAAKASTVKRFLKDNRAQTMNFLASDDALAGGDPFEIGNGIPLIKIFDRQGTLQKTICGGGSDNEALIDQTVQSLLAKK